MSLAPPLANTVDRLNRLGSDIAALFSCRESVVDLMRLALVCREHVLLLGPPGTGKSELVTRFARGVRATPFHYLLTRFTEPSELFGPIDLKSFQEGLFHVATEGMLPHAQVAFLDEVFQASSAILNTLLSLVHERTFHNGATAQRVPLISLFGASNALPDDSNLLAFSDRFILRAQVEPVPDSALDDLLSRGWDLELAHMTEDAAVETAWIDTDGLARLHAALPEIRVDDVQPLYVDLIRRLRAVGVALSERRLVKGLKLIRAAALLSKRDHATAADFWPLEHVWNSPDEITTLREMVRPMIEQAGGRTAPAHRDLETITDDLEALRGRRPDSESAWVIHLGNLGQLRREALLHHAGPSDLLSRIDREIETQLSGRDEFGAGADGRR